MHPKMVMFFTFCFVTATLMCLFIEGSFIGDEEVIVMNALTGISMLEVSGSGLWTVPKLIGGFFTVGVPHLIMWDYSFLEGDWEIFKWFVLYPLSAGFVWGIAVVFIQVISGFFSRAR